MKEQETNRTLPAHVSTLVGSACSEQMMERDVAGMIICVVLILCFAPRSLSLCLCLHLVPIVSLLPVLV
jgi:hypothetical protein